MALGRQTRKTQTGELLTRRAGMLVCLLLLTVVTFVQVAHVHPVVASSNQNAGQIADQCQICVVMHSAAPVSAAAPAVIFTSLSTPVPIPVLHTVVRPWHCAMFNRPPPSHV